MNSTDTMQFNFESIFNMFLYRWKFWINDTLLANWLSCKFLSLVYEKALLIHDDFFFSMFLRMVDTDFCKLFLIKSQTLPEQEEARRVTVWNIFSFPSICLRQMYKITSMWKFFFVCNHCFSACAYVSSFRQLSHLKYIFGFIIFETDKKVITLVTNLHL